MNLHTTVQLRVKSSCLISPLILYLLKDHPYITKAHSLRFLTLNSLNFLDFVSSKPKNYFLKLLFVISDRFWHRFDDFRNLTDTIFHDQIIEDSIQWQCRITPRYLQEIKFNGKFNFSSSRLLPPSFFITFTSFSILFLGIIAQWGQKIYEVDFDITKFVISKDVFWHNL